MDQDDFLGRLDHSIKERDHLMRDMAELQDRLSQLIPTVCAQDTHLAKVRGTSTMAPPLFCKDCRFSKLHTSPKEKWICSHSSSRYVPEQSLVTGFSPEPRQLHCQTARDHDIDNVCGPNGHHWKQR